MDYTATHFSEPSCIRAHIYVNQTFESCFYAVQVPMGPAVRSALQTRALDDYKTHLAYFVTVPTNTPVLHDVCFLPDGQTVRFEGMHNY